MPDISIRPVHGQTDIVALQSLFRSYGNHLAANPSGAAGICIEDFDREIEALPAPYMAVLLASVDDVAAGCIALKSFIRPGEEACEMKRLYVADGYRGVGLGRKLVLSAMDYARQNGLKTIYLDTVPAAMPAANRLYNSIGFDHVDRYNRNPVAGVRFFRRAL